ncbi:MAG TPA: 16S rRNA (adenine(1518)-N(6)/adenine(1519)-N(6))-dimethyltransferase RsmA [Desulfobacterales bacterium]|nr:16S rRNA (adenine(1518)-N(6)/adenine(1519)-N(6))-dimethyltransferase RsmA [Desulfobacterales bacterium]
MTTPRILLEAWNIRAKKQLGQHFLIDPSTAGMITKRAGVMQDDIVLEIGSGLGALTVPIAGIAKKVYAVEKDWRIIPLLKNELLANDLHNVILIEQDILRLDIKKLAEAEGRKILVTGNLPYNISSQVLVRLIRSRDAVCRAVLMFQKELAQRIIAPPGSRDYGRLSVMLGYCAEIKRLAEIKALLFFPKPKVDSEVLEIKFRTVLENPATDEAFFFRVIRAAFGKRRKTLKNALSGSELEIDSETVREAFITVGIDPSRRAETLTVSEFVALSNRLNEHRQ